MDVFANLICGVGVRVPERKDPGYVRTAYPGLRFY